ncbi:MAG TPA: PilZ domain-containing protein [Terriglobales bacterium]|nr:PilZ domain-containing protein [Terriglobales bacterium]
MGSRRQSRRETALAVNVCGTDANGRAYIERAVTENISHNGALIKGVRCAVRTGDIVVVRCADHTGRFRVIWDEVDAKGAKRVGVARLTSCNRVEDLEGAEPEPDQYMRPRKQVRRRYPRFKCEVAAELRLKDIVTPMWVTTANLGEEGCSVNTLVSVPAGTELTIAMWLGTEKVWAQGVVVTSLYGLGTGIMFTSLSRQSRQHLREFLSSQSEDLTDRRGEASAAQPELIQLRDEPKEFTISIPLAAYNDVPVL